MINKAFPVLAMSIFACMLGSGIVVPLLPLYAEDLGAGGLWIGVVYASYPIARVLATPIVGRISDRSGRKRYISIGLFIYGVVSFGFTLVTSAPQLVFLRLLHGVAGAMILPVAQAYVGDISPTGEEGKWMGYANAAFMGGFGFGPLLGGVLSEYLGMDAAFVAMGSLSIIAFVIAIIFLPEITPQRSAAAYPSLRDMAKSTLMSGLISVRLALSMGMATFFAFLPVLAANDLGLSVSLIGTLVATYMLLSAVLAVPFGRIADRLNRKILVVSGCVVSALFLFAVPSGQSFNTLLAIAVVGSIGSAITVPAASALAVQVGREYGMGFSIALLSVAQSVGAAVGPIVGGAVAEYVSLNSAFLLGAVMSVFGAGVFVWLTRRSGWHDGLTHADGLR